MLAALKGDVPGPATFWKTAYRNLLWYEPYAGGHLPHIYDSNALKGTRAWLTRAKLADAYLATEFNQPITFNGQCDRLLTHFAPGAQRQNYLGTGLSCLIAQALSYFIGVPTQGEVPVSDIVPAAKDKSYYSGSNKIDLLAEGRGKPRVGISNKWSLRNDRDTEIAHMATFLKTHSPVKYLVVVTNEFGLGRLNQLLNFDSIDGVYHLNRALLAKVYEPGPIPNGRLRDVSALFADVKRWTV